MSRLVIAFLIALSAVSAFATDDPPPQFLIERIDVRNTHHASPAIIRAETRLREGQTYSEAQLREASYRVARLPFVLRAEYSLEKGSQRDAYVFVITVSETKPLFYDVDLTGSLGLDWDGSTNISSWSNLLLGGRMFAGSRSVFHLAAGTVQQINPDYHNDARTVQAGYTQYDLFGSRAFANFNVAYGYGGTSGSQPSPTLSAVFGIPLSANQTLTLGLLRYSARARFRINLSGDTAEYKSHGTSGNLAWSYDTTDSPFFPTRGETISLSAEKGVSQYDGTRPASITAGRESTGRSVGLNATKYWAVSERNTISSRLQAGIQKSETKGALSSTGAPADWSDRYTAGGLFVRFSHSFFDAKRMRLSGDNRLEAEAGVVHSSISDRSPSWNFDGSNTSANVGLWWARRNAWGLVRIGATYTW